MEQSKIATPSGGTVIVPAIQAAQNATASASLNQTVTLLFTGNAIPSNFLQAQSQSVDLKIERSSLPAQIKDITLRFKVTNAVSSDVQLAQTQDWIEHYELKQGTKEIFRDYNDMIKVQTWAGTPINRHRTL